MLWCLKILFTAEGDETTGEFWDCEIDLTPQAPIPSPINKPKINPHFFKIILLFKNPNS